MHLWTDICLSQMGLLALKFISIAHAQQHANDTLHVEVFMLSTFDLQTPNLIVAW